MTKAKKTISEDSVVEIETEMIDKETETMAEEEIEDPDLKIEEEAIKGEEEDQDPNPARTPWKENSWLNNGIKIITKVDFIPFFELPFLILLILTSLNTLIYILIEEMNSDFLDKFKGKTTKVPKGGVSNILEASHKITGKQRQIKKIDGKPHTTEK